MIFLICILFVLEPTGVHDLIMDEKQLKLLLIFGSGATKVQEDMKKIQSCADELRLNALPGIR